MRFAGRYGLLIILTAVAAGAILVMGAPEKALDLVWAGHPAATASLKYLAGLLLILFLVAAGLLGIAGIGDDDEGGGGCCGGDGCDGGRAAGDERGNGGGDD